MRRFVLPSSLMLAILLTAGVLAALKSPDDAFVQRFAGGGPTASVVEPLANTALTQPPPVDAAAWEALGRSESAQGDHAQAVVAFRNATRLRPDDPTLLTEYAFSAAVTTRRTDEDDPQRLIGIALQLDPTSPKALTLAGTLALDRGDFETAAQDWERLARLEPADSAMRRDMETSAAQARSLAEAHAGHIQLARADLRARPHQ